VVRTSAPGRNRLQLASPPQALYLFDVRAERGQARSQPEGPIIPSKLRHIPAAFRTNGSQMLTNMRPAWTVAVRSGHVRPATGNLGRTHARVIRAPTAR
jgi:hypothetical protein